MSHSISPPPTATKQLTPCVIYCQILGLVNNNNHTSGKLLGTCAHLSQSLYDDDDVAAVVLNKNESIHEWLGTLWLPVGYCLSHLLTMCMCVRWLDLIDSRVDCWQPQHVYDGSEEHTSELQSHSDLVCRLLLEKKKTHTHNDHHTWTQDT